MPKHATCDDRYHHDAMSALVRDPVCGMVVDPATAKGGRTVHVRGGDLRARDLHGAGARLHPHRPPALLPDGLRCWRRW